MSVNPGKVYLKAYTPEGKTISKADRRVFDRSAQKLGFNVSNRNGIATKTDSNLDEAKILIDKVGGVGYVVVQDAVGQFRHWVSVNENISIMELNPQNEASAADLFERFSRCRNIVSVCAEGGYAGLFNGSKIKDIASYEAKPEDTEALLKEVKKKRKVKPRVVAPKKHRIYDGAGRPEVRQVRYENSDEFNRGMAHFKRSDMSSTLNLDYVNQEEVNGGHQTAEAVGLDSWSVLLYSENHSIKHALVVMNHAGQTTKSHIVGLNESQRMGLFTRLGAAGTDFDKQIKVLKGFVNAIF